MTTQAGEQARQAARQIVEKIVTAFHPQALEFETVAEYSISTIIQSAISRAVAEERREWRDQLKQCVDAHKENYRSDWGTECDCAMCSDVDALLSKYPEVKP